jgi:N-acetylgalactosamine-6-sulfatase
MKKIVLLLIALLYAAPSFAAEKARPNIIFILADDMGWGDLHCYGHPYAKTPHLDKLAAEGTRFQQFYATGVTCCPSRTGFMTSWLPARYPVYPANGGFAERSTITALLKKQGYATGHFGKWHIGPEDQQKPGTYGIAIINSGGGAANKTNPAGRDAPIYDQAIQFIEQHKDGPFYMNVWGHIPHHKVNPPQSYVDKLKELKVDESKFSKPMQEKFAACKKIGGDVSEHMRIFLADVHSLDEDIGRLLKRLDDLGLRQNTIVVFSSDQGAAPIRTDGKKVSGNREGADNSRLHAMGYAGPLLRGGKHGQYEGGVRIPFIVRWPSHTPAGRVDEKSVLSAADWLPTLCALTGTKINVANFDGEDTSAAWLGHGEHTRNKPLLWKTSAPNSPGTIRIGDWKLHDQKRGEGELYNVVTDPGEMTNLADKEPAKAKELSAKLKAWQATLPKEYIKADDGDK